MGAASPRRALLVWIVGILAWATVSAPDLERRVEGGALGTWRSVELAALAPFVRLHALARAPFDVEPAVVADAATVATSAPSVASAAVPVPTGTPTAAPTPTPRRHPTAEEPLRLLVVGDSIARDLGWALSSTVSTDPPLAVTVDTHAAAGLARPDYFDWEKQLTTDLEEEHPELVVAMFGGNDAQPFLVDGEPVQVGTAAWRRAYAERVRRFMAKAAADRDVIWVGLPIMADPSFSDLVRDLDDVYDAEARTAGIAYVGSWDLFADGKGRYAAFLPNADGRLEPMRQADGIHLSMPGATRLARRLLGVIAAGWPAATPGAPAY